MGSIRVTAPGIVVKKVKELLVQFGSDPIKGEKFARLIGGGVGFQEKAEDTLRREFREELGAELENIRLIEVVQNIFTYRGEKGHEIIFVYRADFKDPSFYQKELKILDSKHEDAGWILLQDVVGKKQIVYPALDYRRFANS